MFTCDFNHDALCPLESTRALRASPQEARGSAAAWPLPAVGRRRRRPRGRRLLARPSWALRRVRVLASLSNTVQRCVFGPRGDGLCTSHACPGAAASTGARGPGFDVRAVFLPLRTACGRSGASPRVLRSREAPRGVGVSLRGTGVAAPSGSSRPPPAPHVGPSGAARRRRAVLSPRLSLLTRRFIRTGAGGRVLVFVTRCEAPFAPAWWP